MQRGWDRGGCELHYRLAIHGGDLWLKLKAERILYFLLDYLNEKTVNSRWNIKFGVNYIFHVPNIPIWFIWQVPDTVDRYSQFSIPTDRQTDSFPSSLGSQINISRSYKRIDKTNISSMRRV